MFFNFYFVKSTTVKYKNKNYLSIFFFNSQMGCDTISVMITLKVNTKSDENKKRCTWREKESHLLAISVSPTISPNIQTKPGLWAFDTALYLRLWNLELLGTENFLYNLELGTRFLGWKMEEIRKWKWKWKMAGLESSSHLLTCITPVFNFEFYATP